MVNDISTRTNVLRLGPFLRPFVLSLSFADDAVLHDVWIYRECIGGSESSLWDCGFDGQAITHQRTFVVGGKSRVFIFDEPVINIILYRLTRAT